jgi:hypothetical protein
MQYMSSDIFSVQLNDESQSVRVVQKTAAASPSKLGSKADEDGDGEMSVGGDTRSENVCRQPKLCTRQAAGSYKARPRIPANTDGGRHT